MKLSLILVASALMAAPHWSMKTTGVTARLRGISGVNTRVAWASGSGGTVLRTTDGGKTWQHLTVTTDQLDFRDIDAIDENTAYVLSIGNGPASRIYRTNDAGKTWTMQFKNEEPKAFFDAMSFWDANHGLVIGDSVEGKLWIMRTENGGRTWSQVSPAALPPALENEGAFAASGTNIAVLGKSHAWIGMGAATKSRVLRTDDGGRTWKVAETPLASGPSAGIFSIAFRDLKHGVIVGGDYRKESDADHNLAFTSDGGVTWTLGTGLSGFRSVVAYVPDARTPALVSVGPTGTDYSQDDGRTWRPIEGDGFDTFSFVRGDFSGWAAGANGRIGMLLL